MRSRFKWIFTLLIAMTMQFSFAQEKTITGVVTDGNAPIPGANVTVKGNAKGVSAGFDGKYSIKAKEGDVLEFSFMGMRTITKTVGKSNIINTILQDNTQQLSEVVINVFGVEQKKGKETITSSRVKAQALQTTGETNLANALAGKASNVIVVASSGDPGAGQYVQIRGQNTLTGTARPLYVVDGIPISADELGSGTNGVVQQSRTNDINPADIADIQILKGASAAALWGPRAANGVILITTKKGKKGKLSVELSSTFSQDSPNIDFKTQNIFGQGTGGRFVYGNANSWGDLISRRSGGADVFNTSGARFVADNGNVYYPITTKNSQDNFNDTNFNSVIGTGNAIDNHLSVSGGTETASFYLGLGHLRQKGIIRSSDYERTTVDFSSNIKVAEKTTFKSKFTFSTNNSNRIQTGSNTSGLYLGLYRNPADFDIRDYSGTYYDASNNATLLAHRAYRNPIGANANPIYNNPIWTTDVQQNPNKVNRYIAGVEIQHEFSKYFNLLGRMGLDGYTDMRLTMFNMRSAENAGRGSANQSVTDSRQLNIDIMGTGDAKLSDKLNLSYLGGINFGSTEFDQRGGSYQDFILNTGTFSFDNATTANRNTFFNRTYNKFTGLYSTLDFDYAKTLFAKFGGRYETSSVFGPNFKWNFYPSAELAYKFIKPDNKLFINEGKLRATYGQVAINPAEYRTTTYIVGAGDAESWGPAYDAAGYNGAFELSSLEGNKNLKPEIKTEYEFGIDLTILNRINLSATYYNNNIKDNLVQTTKSGTSGYSQEYGNFADLENKGFEVELNAKILKDSNFKWELYGNWGMNRNKVTRLEGTDSLFLNGFAGTSSRAVLDQPVGVLWGGKWERDANNNLVLDSEGFPIASAKEGILGDPNPKWRAGAGSRFGYKGLTMNVLFDCSFGGDLWDGTNGALNNFGRSTQTGEITTFPNQAAANGVSNYAGVNAGTLGWLNPDGTYSVRGNIQDFGAGPRLLDQSWYTDLGGGFGPVGEQFIKSATWVKLRELSLGYRFNNNLLKGTGLSDVSINLIGRNLWLWTEAKDLHQDPESNLTGGSIGRGLQYFNAPNTKSFAISINVKI